MPPVARPYQLDTDLFTRARIIEEQRLENSVLGLVRANQIEANSIRLGIGGNVAVDPGTLTAGDSDSLLDFPVGTLTLGTANSLIDIPPGTLSVGAEVLVPTSAITNTMLAPDSVTTSKVSANAIGANEIAANAIVAGKIATGAVTTGKLQAGAVTADKLDVTTLSAITASLGTITDVASLDSRPGAPHLHFDRDELIVRNTSDDRAMHIFWNGMNEGVVLDMGFRKSWNFVPGVTFTDLGATPDYVFGHIVGHWETASPSRYVLSMTILDSSFIWVEGGGHGVSVGNGPGANAWNWVCDANGEMYSDAYNLWSDERAKENIRPLESRRADLKKLRPIRYRHSDTKVERMGFSAQEVSESVPELALVAPTPSRRDMESVDGRMGIDASAMLVMVVQAVQELSDEVDNLKAKK